MAVLLGLLRRVDQNGDWHPYNGRGNNPKAQGRHDNGKHKGWYKNGKSDDDDRGEGHGNGHGHDDH